MKVVNIHQRDMPGTALQVGKLIDSLASANDRLWPVHDWPAMKFDRKLAVGAIGGHGPVRYFVESYSQSSKIKFRFTAPRGFNGFHALKVVRGLHNQVVLQHTLRMEIEGPAWLTWPLFYRPLHDALVEDALTTAERSLGATPKDKRWSFWVRVLRLIFRGARRRRR